MISALLLLAGGPRMLLAPIAPKVDTDVVYAHPSGSEEQKMDIYYPEMPENAKPTKSGLVVVIHGGAWMSGKKEDMAQLCQNLQKAGLLSATINYRLAPKTKWPAMIDDCQTAVRYFRANAAKYNIDPERIAAAGASAGGHLSLLLGFRETRDPKPTEYSGFSSKVRAVLNLFGPADFDKDFDKTLDPVFALVLGKPRAQAATEIREASPVTYIDNKSAAVFTIQGRADPLVPYAQAERLDATLKKAGIFSEMHLIDGMAHGPVVRKPDGKPDPSADAFDVAVAGALKFLLKYVGPPS